jgi:hypothetical protein
VKWLYDKLRCWSVLLEVRRVESDYAERVDAILWLRSKWIREELLLSELNN